MVVSVAVHVLDARRTNNRKVVGSIGAVRSWSLRLSAFDGLGSGMGKW